MDAAGKSELILARLKQRYPEIYDESHLASLANVWAMEVEQIINKMFDITRSARPPMHISIREKAIFELAKLTLWLTDLVIDKKLEAKCLEDLDAKTESQLMQSTLGRERIDSTGTVLAEHIWLKLYDQWHEPIRRIVVPRQEMARAGKAKLITSTNQKRTRENHYTPRFSNKYWTDGTGQILVFSRSVGGGVQTKVRPYQRWGFQVQLYSQHLEDLLSRIDNDAKIPYEKLLNVVPLTPAERNQWITFLIVQWLRTPSLMLQLMGRLKQKIKVDNMNYGTNPADLARAYETLFQDDRLYRILYVDIAQRDWYILHSPPDTFFVKPDVGVAVSGNHETEDWSLTFPLSPDKCLLVYGYNQSKEKRVIPPTISLDKEAVDEMNAMLATHAHREVVTIPANDNPNIREVLSNTLANGELRRDWIFKLIEPHWGKPR
jgi:hypothetical protein